MKLNERGRTSTMRLVRMIRMAGDEEIAAVMVLRLSVGVYLRGVLVGAALGIVVGAVAYALGMAART